ncbi:MAG: DNA-binding protein [Bacteroides sp.]|nr:DNA-binding protein [Bacteroides sp.]
MSINLKAKETLQNIGIYKGSYRYILQTELYSSLNKNKVIREAAIRSGLAEGTINAAWASIGEVIKAWATEGHSVPIPGVGSMRFSVRATSVSNVSDVSTTLITSRRVIFTPSIDIKNELKNTSINITCYNKDGEVIKQVTSSDSGEVEEEENKSTEEGTTEDDEQLYG